TESQAPHPQPLSPEYRGEGRQNPNTHPPEVIMADPAKLKLAKDHSVRQILLACTRVASSKTMYVGGSEFTVCETDLTAARADFNALGKHESYVTSITMADKVPVSGGYDGKLTWWDVSKKAAVRTVNAHSKWIRQVVTSPDG